MRRTVAQAELAELRAGEIRRERRHVGGRRAAEPVDGLPRVADRPQVLAVACDRLHQAHAGPVNVLVFIDQQVPVAQTHGAAHGFVLLDEQRRQHDEVAEIDRAASCAWRLSYSS